MVKELIRHDRHGRQVQSVKAGTTGSVAGEILGKLRMVQP
jgi:hypothetical protein